MQVYVPLQYEIFQTDSNFSINARSTSQNETELRAGQTLCGDGTQTSSKTPTRTPKLPNPPSVHVSDNVALEDVLVPAISALSTLALIMILASAAIVLVQTWNGFCERTRDGGGEDGYLDNNDRRALTQLSLRYCRILQ